MGQDGFIDSWLKNTKRLDLLTNLWNDNNIKQVPNFYEVELIPLNKVWP